MAIVLDGGGISATPSYYTFNGGYLKDFWWEYSITNVPRQTGGSTEYITNDDIVYKVVTAPTTYYDRLLSVWQTRFNTEGSLPTISGSDSGVATIDNNGYITHLDGQSGTVNFTLSSDIRTEVVSLDFYSSSEEMITTVASGEYGSVRYNVENNIDRLITKPILHLKMDDNADNTTVLDYSGNDYHGEAARNTSAITTTGKFGSALTFNGTSDQISLGDLAALEFASSGQFTVCMWVKPAAKDESGYLIAKYNGTAGWGVLFRGAADAIVLKKDGNADAAISSAVFTDTDWVHIALSFNSGIATFYRNGTAAGGGSGATWTTPTTQNVILGNRSEGPNATTYFAGAMDDVRLYNVALTPSQILTIYSGGDETLQVYDKNIFSLQNHGNAIYTRNTSCWASSIDLTCCSPWNSTGGAQRAGTLISPRHILFAAHYPITNGATIRFVTSNNTVVSRIMTNSISLESEDPELHYPDFVVGILDSDVNECTFAKVLSNDFEDYIPNNGFRIPVIMLDQEEKALIADMQNILDTGMMCIIRPQKLNRLMYFEELVNGDSGNPCLIIINNETVILTVWTSSGSGTAVHAWKTEINAAMATLGGGYTLTEIDLSEFNTY